MRLYKKGQWGFKLPKNEFKVRSLRVHVTKHGDRTLTPAKKYDLKKSRGFICEECGHKFDSRYLEVHHRKSVSSYKHPSGFTAPVFSIGSKIKPKYDRKSNLMVICIKCHDKTKKKKKTSQDKYNRQMNDFIGVNKSHRKVKEPKSNSLNFGLNSMLGIGSSSNERKKKKKSDQDDYNSRLNNMLGI